MRASKQHAYTFLASLRDGDSESDASLSDDQNFTLPDSTDTTSSEDETTSLPENAADAPSVLSPAPITPQPRNTTPSTRRIQNESIWDNNVPTTPQTTQTPAENIVRHRGGPTNFIKNRANDPLDIFMELFGHTNVQKICEATNQYSGEDMVITTDDILAFIGLMIARGVYKGKDEPRRSLWNPNSGRPIFSATMGVNKFENIMKNLRFDDRTTRSTRKVTDKFCHIRELWDSILDNCAKCFKPNASVTIDEQLMGCRARCPFTQYMSSKPDKFGIKFWFLCCAESSYILAGFPYLGKDEERDANMGLGEHVVLKLMEPYFDMGLNVTTDNFFSSLELCKKLLVRKTTFIGTLRQN